MVRAISFEYAYVFEWLDEKDDTKFNLYNMGPYSKPYLPTYRSPYDFYEKHKRKHIIYLLVRIERLTK